MAEDYSKAATADNIIAYCQTSEELKLNLARLFIAKARDEEREQSVLISQAYRVGQFCMGASHMSDAYWDRVEALAGTPEPENLDQQEETRRIRRRTSTAS